MNNFIVQFFSSSDIAIVWQYLFKFLFQSPIGMLISLCIVSFSIYVFVRVFS